ncbi:tyrosine-protein kinase receptor Tie-1 isoform X2 [Macrotis lagotis]|uniref:tyrosine-protein kinase receptor Tie-1 isoform X2 n=1 Tax=Macrotis lagotis TaxID=92651 RepID=UPI003D684010
MGQGGPLLLLFLLTSQVGAAMDLTLLADLRLTDPQRFFLTCVSGEPGSGRGLDVWDPPLLLEKDDRIIRTLPRQPLHSTRNGSRHITLRGFSQPSDLVGVFSCIGGTGARHTRVIYVHNSPRAHLFPDKVTHTVNVGDTAVLTARIRTKKQGDVIWKSNGSLFNFLDFQEAQDGQFKMKLQNLRASDGGIYSATYLQGNPLTSAFFRVIVRGCGAGQWGPNCARDCPICLHGGICHDQNGECVCPPGFTGTRCEQACREGRFGQDCQQQCPGTSGCRGLTFCLPDPYGCSCGAGWHGGQCQDACAPGWFGASCYLQCRCQNGGTCDRFSGCVCPSGWHGEHCEKSDRIPKIVNMASELDFNVGAMPVVSCAATGNPSPVRGSMELRRPDNTVFMPSKAIMEIDKTTSEFQVPPVSLADSGLWECRVSTSGGQDSRHFKVNIKVPPVPKDPPRLLARLSRQLVVSPLVPFSGDGPISSVRLCYRPQDSSAAWSTIVVDPSENVTLMNLRPQTEYSVLVQLSRPGEGGEGAWGPPSIMATDCLGPPAPRLLRAEALSDSSIQLTWQRPEAPAGTIAKYIVELQAVGGSGEPLWIDTEGNEESTIIQSLNASTCYHFRVRASAQGPGDWSEVVEETTLDNGLKSESPAQKSRMTNPDLDQQLVLAVVGSVSATCLTILAALLALVCIRKSCLHRRRTFTYQSGSGEETVLQFSSGTLTLTRRPKPQPEPLSYPVLEWEDITFEDLIGEGNFGQVLRAMIRKDGLQMNAAVKMLKEFASENDHRDFAGELEVLCKLGHHPNIINLLGACENRGYLYIAIEYAPYGNLLDFLRKSRVLETDPAFAHEHGTASTLTSQQLLRFASDVSKGMQYLSEKQFIHRDLAARNVLVGENLASKIADFGLSRGEEVYVKKTMGRLPVRWMAIESLNYSVYTTKSDVWSFGVLLWEIVSLGGTPYCGMTCAELYEKLPQGYRMEQPRNCDDEVYELMRQCWRDRPYERPPFAQISVQLGRMLEARKAYVNMALFENFTYAGIDATAEEA